MTLYETQESATISLCYTISTDGISQRRLKAMTEFMKGIGSKYCAGGMVKEYTEYHYKPFFKSARGG